MVKKNNIFFLTLLITVLFIFSGCGGKTIDCSTKDTTYQKYSFDEESGECFVSDKIRKDYCGNGVAENGETFCNCPKDVDKSHPENGCEGNVGTYLEKQCINKQCVLSENNKVISEKKSLIFTNSDLEFDLRTDVKKPFLLNTNEDNKIAFDLSLFKIKSSETKGIKDIKVKEMKLENSQGNLIGNVVFDKTFVTLGDAALTKYVGLEDIDKYESSETIKLKLIVSYTKESLNKGEVVKSTPMLETIAGSLGKVTIINPNFGKK